MMKDIDTKNRGRKRDAIGGRAVIIGFAAVIAALVIVMLGALLQRSDEKEVKVRYDGQTYQGQQAGSTGSYSGWGSYATSKNDAYLSGSYDAAAPMAPEYDMGASNDAAAVDTDAMAGAGTGDKIAYYYTYDVETTAFDAVWSDLQSFLASSGGYIEDYRVEKAEYDGYGGTGTHSVRKGTYTLRVPAGSVESLRRALDDSDVAHMEREDVRMQDYTDAYADTSLQVRSYQMEYDRLEALIPQAESVTELISIQDRLSSLNYQIQYAEKRLEGIDTEVAYSEVDLTLYEVEYYKAQIRSFRFRMGERIADAFDGFLYGMPEFLFAMVYFLIAGLVAIGLLALAARVWISIRNKKQKEQVIRVVQDGSTGGTGNDAKG